MKRVISKIDKMICDDLGNTSSKRIVGSLLSLFSVLISFWVVLTGYDITDNQTKLLLFTMGSGNSLLGLTVFEKSKR